MQNTTTTPDHCSRSKEAAFIQYCRGFYDRTYDAPDGWVVYPYYTTAQIENAARLLIASARDFVGDSMDRERVRTLMDAAEGVSP